PPGSAGPPPAPGQGRRRARPTCPVPLTDGPCSSIGEGRCTCHRILSATALAPNVRGLPNACTQGISQARGRARSSPSDLRFYSGCRTLPRESTVLTDLLNRYSGIATSLV